MSLTRASGRAERGRWSAVAWEGRSIAVYDSAINALRIIELFADGEIDPVTKQGVLEEMLFPDIGAARAVDDFDGFLAHALWELCGLDIDGSHEGEGGPRAYDWEEDEQVIRASLYQAYGRPWEELSREVSLRDLTAMMGMVPHDTPLGQAIYYRLGDPPERNKYNAEEVERWHRMAAKWSLEGSGADRIEQANKRANDMFEALARSAKHV